MHTLIAMAPLVRLSSADLTNLAVEAPDTPMHQGVCAALDGAGLLDDRGHVRIDEVRAHVMARLDRVPNLRRVLYRTHFLEGKPIWVDDPNFRIENHVRLATLPEPGGETGALAFAEEQMAIGFDRSRPLWELWMLEGYAKGTIGMLMKLHHAIADGPAMVNMLGQIFDLEQGVKDQPVAPWLPDPAPTTADLVWDNVMGKVESFGRSLGGLSHPVLAMRSAKANLAAVVEAIREGRGAPRTSLNRPIGAARRITAIRLPLDEARAVAHMEGVKLNDVFLSIVAGAVRQVLIARGEDVRGKWIRASMAVSRPATRDLPSSGNHAGTMIVPIPVDMADVSELLRATAASTARAKTKQLAVVSTGLMVFLARTGITRAFIRHQHLINVLTTNLPGPPVPLYFAGATVRDPVALPPIAGNVTASFAALSYDGALTLSVMADSSAWPDIEVLKDGMWSSWLELKRAVAPAPALSA